jgi:hypothetical protein
MAVMGTELRDSCKYLVYESEKTTVAIAECSRVHVSRQHRMREVLKSVGLVVYLRSDWVLERVYIVVKSKDSEGG